MSGQTPNQPRGRGRGRGRRPRNAREPRPHRKSPEKAPEQSQQESEVLNSTLKELDDMLCSKRCTIPDVECLVSSALGSIKPDDHHKFIFSLVKRTHDLLRERKSPLMQQIEEAMLKQLEKLYKKNQELYSHVNERRPDPFSLEVLQFAASLSWKQRDLLFSLFGFNEMETGKLVSLISQLMKTRCYETVCVCTTAFELQQSFDVEQVLLPIVILNYYNPSSLMEHYLRPDPKLQVKFAVALDSLCIPGTKHIMQKKQSLGLPYVKDLTHLQPKFLHKLVLRLRKSFNIDLALLPNTVRTQTVEALRFLVNQKYKSHAISDEAWEEVVSYTVRDDAYLRNEFVKLLLVARQVKAAYHFAEKFGILGSFPSIDVSTDRSKPAPKPEVIHTLNIPEDDVYVISTIEELDNIAGDIEACGAVGIDMEWRATYTVDQDPLRISLVQLAIRTKVFLLDMIALNTCTDRQSEVAQFFTNLLSSEKVTKLGYDFQADITKLQESFPYLKPSLKTKNAFVDLKNVQANIEQRYPTLLAIDRDDKKRPYRGLTELLVCCLGEPLDKTEQLSDWERRPLRPAQISYAGDPTFTVNGPFWDRASILTAERITACLNCSVHVCTYRPTTLSALDAFCLLEIHDFLEHSLKGVDPPSSVRALCHQPKRSEVKENHTKHSPSPSSRLKHSSPDVSPDTSHDQADSRAGISQQKLKPDESNENGPCPPPVNRISLMAEKKMEMGSEMTGMSSNNIPPDGSHDTQSEMLKGMMENIGGMLQSMINDAEGAQPSSQSEVVQNEATGVGLIKDTDSQQADSVEPEKVVVSSPYEPPPESGNASEILAADDHFIGELSPPQPESVHQQRIAPGVYLPPSSRQQRSSPWQQEVPKQTHSHVPQNPQKTAPGPTISTADKRRRNRLQGSGALGGVKRPGMLPQNPRTAVPVHNPGQGMLMDAGGYGVQPTEKTYFYEPVAVQAPVEDHVHLLSEPGRHTLSNTSNGESWVIYVPQFLTSVQADRYFGLLHKELNWQQRENKTKEGTLYKEPRKSVWFGEFPYTYSRVSWNHNKQWNEHLVTLKKTIEFNFEHRYNSVLCNLYRDGHDSIAWHSDDEYGLGKEPNIASMSLGDTRHFEMKVKERVMHDEKSHLPLGKKLRIPVTHGSLLIMGGVTQHDWLHSVPKEYHDKHPRINLTYRWIYPDNRDHQEST